MTSSAAPSTDPEDDIVSADGGFTYEIPDGFAPATGTTPLGSAADLEVLLQSPQTSDGTQMYIIGARDETSDGKSPDEIAAEADGAIGANGQANPRPSLSVDVDGFPSVGVIVTGASTGGANITLMTAVVTPNGKAYFLAALSSPANEAAAEAALLEFIDSIDWA